VSEPMLIGLTGYAGSGKDTFAKSLKLRGGFQRVGFADAVKEMALVLDPLLTVPGANEHDLVYLSNVVMAYGWERAKQIDSVRTYLQVLGTDAVRNIVGNDSWVRAAEAKVIGHLREGRSVVMTDVRFENEAAFIHAYGGKVIKIVRTDVGPVNGHISDTGIDSLPVDDVIFNDGTIDDLGEKASRLLWILGA
jgi:hypothetical protein